MHILICDDDAAFGARMAEYVTVYFTARSVQVHTAVCTSAAEVLATPGLELYQLAAFLEYQKQEEAEAAAEEAELEKAANE